MIAPFRIPRSHNRVCCERSPNPRVRDLLYCWAIMALAVASLQNNVLDDTTEPGVDFFLRRSWIPAAKLEVR